MSYPIEQYSAGFENSTEREASAATRLYPTMFGPRFLGGGKGTRSNDPGVEKTGQRLLFDVRDKVTVQETPDGGLAVVPNINVETDLGEVRERDDAWSN